VKEMNIVNLKKINRNRLLRFAIGSLLIILISTVIISCSKKETKSKEPEITHYTCGMHPSVKVSVADYKKGNTKCPICNMDLVPVHKEKEQPKKAEQGITHYTCGMHPSVKVSVEDHKKGNTKCPICNMDLVPVYEKGQASGERVVPTIKLTPNEEALTGVKTIEVKPRHLVKEINTVGKMDYDERRVANVTAWVGGRIDKLYVDFTGKEVKKGDALAMLYSPDLVSTQQEYLLALETLEKVKDSHLPEVIENAESLVESTKKRLLIWGIPEQEIERIEKERETSIHMTIYSPISGTVVKKTILEGQYVKEGSHLYTVSNLSHLWMFADIYEYEMSWIKLNDKVEVVTPAYPGETFTGKVTFIDPVLHSHTRSVKIRADFTNSRRKLKPEMFVNAKIKIALSKKRFPQLAKAFKKKVKSNKVVDINTYKCGCSGKTWTQGAEEEKSCPYCGEAMPECGELIKQEKKNITKTGKHDEILAIPVNALLDTGKRKLVYVDRGGGEYEPREVEVGLQAEDYYPVVRGLKEGERVVTRANFLIDSQTQLTGQEAAAYDAALGTKEK
jgi:multidrug efflux pump subunit AcrA (membrane-fusion protein)